MQDLYLSTDTQTQTRPPPPKKKKKKYIYIYIYNNNNNKALHPKASLPFRSPQPAQESTLRDGRIQDVVVGAEDNVLKSGLSGLEL